jgi:hypothetical protein
MNLKINLSTKELNRLADALSKDLEGYPECAQDWEYNLVKRLRAHVKPIKYICDFCEKEFVDGYISNAITSCRKCYDLMTD